MKTKMDAWCQECMNDPCSGKHERHTPIPWIKSVMHESTRTPEDVARFAGPNAGYVLRAIGAHEDMAAVIHDLIENIDRCEDCAGSGKEHETSACGRCGGQGIVLERGTGLIPALKEALAKAEGRP